jgi:hypothetical protein
MNIASLLHFTYHHIKLLLPTQIQSDLLYPSHPLGSMTSAPVGTIREFVCNLQAFSVVWQMSACLIHFFVSAENLNAKYVTALLPGLSNMLLVCEIRHPSCDSPAGNQYMKGWVLPMV